MIRMQREISIGNSLIKLTLILSTFPYCKDYRGSGARHNIVSAKQLLYQRLKLLVYYSIPPIFESACSQGFVSLEITQAITVGATNERDKRAPYSNYGSCLDIFAPGSNIRSAGRLSDTQTIVMSGTSMACPHVAGKSYILVCLQLQKSKVIVVISMILYIYTFFCSRVYCVIIMLRRYSFRV